MRVLIADDQKKVGKSLAELVSFCNHQIVGVVGSGLEAIQAYTQHHPDLVLMDYRMPKLNGTTALRNNFACAHAQKSWTKPSFGAGWLVQFSCPRRGRICASCGVKSTKP